MLRPPGANRAAKSTWYRRDIEGDAVSEGVFPVLVEQVEAQLALFLVGEGLSPFRASELVRSPLPSPFSVDRGRLLGKRHAK